MKSVSVIESQLAALACWVIKYPRSSIIVTLLVILALALGLSRLTIDVTNESMFREGDPALKQFQQFQTQFGRDDVVVAAIESSHIFSPDFLSKLESYHRDLEDNLPYLDKVTSLVNVTSISDQDGDVLIDDLQAVWPEDVRDFPAFKREVTDNPLYRNLFISQAGNITLMTIRASVYMAEPSVSNQEVPDGFREKIIYWHDKFAEHLSGKPPERRSDNTGFFDDIDQLDTVDNIARDQPLSTPQLQAFIRELKVITSKHKRDDFQIRLMGGSIISDEHVQSIHIDFASLLPVTFLLVFILLFLILRRVAAALIPLSIVALTLLATLGLMGWLSLPITPVTVALPPLLLTIGVADSVHILNAFYGKQGSLDRDSAIISSVQRTGLAVLFTSLTTIAGFLAFVTADIKPIADFGLLVGFGVTLAFLLSVVLIPAILRLQSQQVEKKQTTEYAVSWIKAMWALAQISLRHSNKVLTGVVAVTVLCIPGIFQLQFSHNTLEWFPEDKPVRVNTYWADKVFNGTIPFEIIIDTGKKNGLYDPAIMQQLESFQAYAESLNPEVATMGRATSIVDTVKRIHWVLHQEKPNTAIPDSSDLIAQELLLFEGSGADDIAELIDNNFSMARITTRLSWVDAVDYLPVREQLISEAQKQFSGLANVWATGSVDLISRTLVNIIQSMSSSYLIAAVVIALMLMLLMRSLTLGLVSLIPNFLPIIISLGVMGYIGIPLDMFTVLLGGIALGLAVDDTVHFMHSYRFYRQTLSLSVEESVKQTVVTVGPALLFTTVAMASGFLVFVLSDMNVVVTFGLLLAMTIVNALLLDLLVVPALAKVIDRLDWLRVNASSPRQTN
jgi:hydrophobe/amphiphile efflux-3 (HAE3) family protein